MAVRNLLLPPAAASKIPFLAALLKKLVYVDRSDQIAYTDSSPVSLFNIPANTMVLGVVTEIPVAWAGTSPDLTVGVSGTANRHVQTGDVTETSTGFTATFRPHNYTAAATIIATIGGSSLSAGTARFWLLYRPNSDIQ